MGAVQNNQELLKKLSGQDSEDLSDDNDKDGFLDIVELLAGTNINNPGLKPVDANNDGVPDIFQIKGDMGPQGIEGNPGKDGINGKDGLNGLNGKEGISILWAGTFADDPINPELNQIIRKLIPINGRSQRAYNCRHFRKTLLIQLNESCNPN